MRHVLIGLAALVLGVAVAASLQPARAAATAEEEDAAAAKAYEVEQAALAKRVHITYWEKWVDYNEARGRLDMVDDFNKSQDRIYVHYLRSSWVDREAMLAIRAGSPPDVFGLWAYNTSDFASRNLITPLDDLMKQSGLAADRYIDGYLKLCQFGGKTWALPSASASLALFWNKDHFKAKAAELKKAGLDPTRPPQTLEELWQYAEILTEMNADGTPKVMGFLPTEPGWWNYSWGYWFGGNLIDPATGKVTLDDPANIEAYAWLKRYAEKYGREKLIQFKARSVGSFDSPQNPFMAGKVSMVIQGTWFPMFIQRHAPKMDYGVAAFPSPKGVPGPRALLDTDILCIPAGCKHPKEAWEFILWVQQKGAATQGKWQGMSLATRRVPAEFYEEHPNEHIKVFQDLAASPNAFIVPQAAGRQEVLDAMNLAFEQIWTWPVETAKAADLRGLEGVARAGKIDQLCREEIARILKDAKEKVQKRIDAKRAREKAAVQPR
jgi:multiple sugar transport system substrate-binding protein